MTRDQTLEYLRKARPELRRDFGVARAGVFGSFARDEARTDSDFDVIVEFARAPNFGGFEALRERLQELLGRPVDLVTPDGLHRLVRARALSESIYADA